MPETIHITITGMTCSGCAAHVTDALESTPGVVSALVRDWQKSLAEVRATDAVDFAELVSAVENAGYEASIQTQAVPFSASFKGRAKGNGVSLGKVADPSQEAQAPDDSLRSDRGVYDLVVIGGGSAAFAAALKTSELGGRAAIVNAGPESGGLPTGGTCVNVGCVPSKATIRAAEAVHRARRTAFDGLSVSGEVTDFGAVMQQVRSLVSDLRQHKYLDVVADDPNVTLIEGRARLASDQIVEVDGAPSIRAKYILIATGAQTFAPDIRGLSEVGYLTNETLYELNERPEHLVVLGGGFVGIENAQAFARLGTRVTVLQRSEQIFPNESATLTEALTGYLREDGVNVRTSVVTRAVSRDSEVINIEMDVDGQSESLSCSHLLLATGRRGNTEDLGLEQLGIETDKRGFIKADSTLRTAVPTIFGAGDVLGDRMFVYTAAYEGALAATNALVEGATKRDYTALPWVVFTDPQLAGVGFDERQAIEAGIDAEATILPLDQVPRSLAARDTRGSVTLIRDRETDHLVGARILAPEGAELLMELALAIRYKITTEELSSLFHPYLTLSEAIKIAAITFRKDVGKLSCCAA